jgi:Tfp pilus assembly protein FimT
MRYFNSRGITVLELVIAAVVLGIVAAMAAPEFGDVLKRLKFKASSRDVVSDMRLARSEAIAQRTQFGLYFDYSDNNYVLFKDVVNPSQFTYEIGDSVIKTVNLGQDAWIYSHSFYNSYGSGAIVFKPDGSASCTGNVVLSDHKWENQADIDVLASTGRVRLTYYYRDESS